MGYRLHVRSINRIEYGSGHFTAGTTDEVIRIIRDNFGNDIYSTDDESSFEIPKGDFLDGIEKVKSIPEDEFDRKYPCLVKADYSKEEFVAALQDMYDSADPDKDEIIMDWF